MNKLKGFMKEYPIITTSIIFIVSLLVLKYINFDQQPGSIGFLLKELILSIVVFIPFIIIVGRKEANFSVKGFKFAFSKYWWILFLPIIFLIFIIILLILVPEMINPNIIKTFFPLLITCLCVGVFEEVLFRGFIFNTFLFKLGKDYKGLLLSAVWSSFIFGIMHVFSSLFNGDLLNFIALFTIIGKILQTGVLGFVFAVLYIKTQNIWVPIVFHGLNDFIELFAVLLINIEEEITVGEYVQTGSEGLFIGIVYFVLVLLYFPVVIRGIKDLKTVSIPNYGFFKSLWEPKTGFKIKKIS